MNSLTAPLAVWLLASAMAVQADPEWESVDSAGNPLVYNYEVPPGGELLRACLCSAPHGTVVNAVRAGVIHVDLHWLLTGEERPCCR